MNVSTGMRRITMRLVTGLVTASLAIGTFGAVGTTAAPSYSTTTPMILYNVSPEDLLANKQGVCDGTFKIVIRNVLGNTNSLRYLDAAQHCGLKAVLYFSTTVSGGTVYPSRVPALVAAVRNHPALYGYLTVKEPSWVGISATEIRSMYQAFHVADPNHPVVALFGDIPHFGSTSNPYTAGMADIAMVDWYPVETARGGCSSTGSSYVAYGSKWYSTKVRPTVAAKTPGVPIWVMVQVHKYTAPSCHKKQRPTWDQMLRQVHEAFNYAGASGIAFHTFQNDNYQYDLRRDTVMMGRLRAIARAVAAGTF
ncbi:MAG: hypothetical protein ABI553_07240 [Chloroflexota bacterium]